MAKINDIRNLAETTAEEVTRSPRDWMRYLDTAANLYRYSFTDNLLIHVQRPDATACAELEQWNLKMNRWVNRGAKGIALLDDTGPRRKLRYVFDVSDTHMVRGGRTPSLWKMQEQYNQSLLNHLTDAYGLEGDDATSIENALLEIASQITDENMEEAMEGLQYEVKGSYLEGLEEDTVRVQFRNLMMNSAYYSLSRRCDLNPMEDLGEEDFIGITDFNHLSVLSFLGNAVSEAVEPVLRDIGRTIKGYYLEEQKQIQEKQIEESQNMVANTKEMLYNKFNELTCKSEKGGIDHGNDISSQGRLPVSEPGTGGRAGDHREVRDATEDISEGTQEELVSEHASDRETGQPSDGSRESSRGEDRSSNETTEEDISRAGQSDTADGMGRIYEQSDSNGRGEHLDGVGVQLIEETTEHDLSEAEEIEASALSLPELPTVEQQKRAIEERMAALYADEISIPSEVVDEVLRSGSNHDRSQLRIIHNFMSAQSMEDYTDFIKREYGTGGKGYQIGGQEYSIWFDELGMQIALGHTVEDKLLDKAFLSWEDVTGRIKQLLDQGEYAPQVILDAARDNALLEHAQALAFMERDMSEGVAELVFDHMELFQGGFPTMEENLKEYLSHPENVTELVERLEGLAIAYEEDPSIMRFHHYKPNRVLGQFQKLVLDTTPFQAREDFIWQPPQIIITQDEIDAFLARGGAYSDGRLSTYSYFLQHEDNSDRTDFIKERYGTGGCSHALCGADNSHADYDAKGLQLARGAYGNEEVKILLKWSAVAKRVAYLIEQDKYLQAKDFSRMADYERSEMAGKVIRFYNYLPQEVMRPWEGNMDYGEYRNDVISILSNEDGQAGLLEKMDAILAELPVDFRDYERKVQLLSELHQYVEGNFTIFPVKEQIPEAAEMGQISMFEFLNTSEVNAPEEVLTEVADQTVDAKDEALDVKEAESPVGDEEESHLPFEAAKKLWEEGYVYDDYVLRSTTGELIRESMENTDFDLDDFSPEQVEVIRQVAEKGGVLEPILNPEFSPEQMQLITDVVDRMMAQEKRWYQNEVDAVAGHVMTPEEVNEQRKERNMPLEPVEELEGATQSASSKEVVDIERHNFHITDNDLGAGGPKAKYHANVEAIQLLQTIESENRLATPEEQEVLSRYVGWGGIPNAFDERNSDWSNEYQELKSLLSAEEYEAARASTLNAFYTSPTVIGAMYEALGNMGLEKGNLLEPSCGVGNFMGLLPESMQESKMYGVELDSISGRIAQQLYQKNPIAVQGFETTDYPDSFFDCVIGNVPFGSYKVADRKYDRHNFMIHDYFIAKSLDLVRPGGVVAVVTSSGTMDKQSSAVREYIANRADLLGAIRLPNNAFQRNANTGVVADILFFQKRDRVSLEKPDWIQLGVTEDGHTVNAYFAEHPEMVLGEFTTESTQYGKQEVTVRAIEGANLAEQLKMAVSHIHGSITEVELEDSELDEVDTSIPADPSVKNFSFTNVDGQVYYRENSKMNRMELPKMTSERVLGMIAIRNLTQELIECQLNDGNDAEVKNLQNQLNEKYDDFTAQYGLISNTANRRSFNQDSSYCLLSSLELLDEQGNLERKADIFTKRTIRKAEPVTSVDTASEALAVCIGEKARVDVPFMAELAGKSEQEITDELAGVIFQNPLTNLWEPSDEYLSGNVREKLRTARTFAEGHPEYEINVQYLEKVQPKELEASEIEVRLGATWINPQYVTDFMGEIFHTPFYRLGRAINCNYASVSGQWEISGKTTDSGNPMINSTYGTRRANAYRLLEDALNLKDTKIYDTVSDAEGKERRVLNKQETMLAQQKQEMIKDAFKEWVFKDIDRREDLCQIYNELYNSIRPREYDGSHIQFVGMTPEISLMPHQKNAVAHVLYGNNTLLAHCVGAGKTFQMIASGMESKRLGLAQKCLYVVPNHLTEQWGNDFLRLYPGANVLVATKKDFEPANRKKFCSRIAMGDYDAIIIGHSQFERIPLSKERQVATINRQIDDITNAIADASSEDGSRFTIKQLEKTKKGLQVRLEKLNDQQRKDDVVTFEQLGVDRLFVDESHFYKNMFLYTKMRNVAGIAQTDAQKSSDMFMKCQYMDEITGGKGVTFATGTPVSNSMVELYTIMRYLQYDQIQQMGLGHFDAWAASFGETVTAIELSPEGTGYRAKTRFARFFNLPELISLFKESADIQTADMLNLPIPEAEYINEVLKPSETQQEMVSSFADRAEAVRGGAVDPRADNMLKITNDGRKCALDQRLINDMLPDEPDSKVNRCVDNAFQIWQESMPNKSAQLIFCDLSTPKSDGSFNVYDDVREKLVAKGIPREEVAFIHEATTEVKKAELFAKVRSGQVRVLLGSTPKLGAGTNIQDRLIALHHLDCPWKPADLEQQEGRILRQGNQNEKVKIFRYVTENTFDSYMWQILENKQKFISQVMTSKSPVRACEDVDDTALSYAEIKALATGNPYIKEKMDLDIQVSKLKLLKANHTSQKYRLESDIARTYPMQITAVKERIAGLSSDLEVVKPVLEQEKESFVITIGGKTFTDKKEAGTALIAACAGLKAVNTAGVVGDYHGFSLTANFDSFYQKYMLTVKRQCSYHIEIGKDALGNVQRINNVFSGIGKQLPEAQRKLENLQEQLKTALEEVQKPFAQEDVLTEKMERLSELNALLNMDESGPSEAIGVEEDADVADCGRKPSNLAGRVSGSSRIADSPNKPSVLSKLKEKQEQAVNTIQNTSHARKNEQVL